MARMREAMKQLQSAALLSYNVCMKSAYSHFAKACGYRTIVVQAVIILVLVSAMWLFQSGQAAISALLGGGVWFLPTALFLSIFLFRKAEREPVQILIDFYIGELVKFFGSIILMILVFYFYPIQVLAFVLGYLGAVFSVWGVLFWEWRAERR